MHHLRTGKQLFGLLFGNFAGTLRLLLGAHALVLLQLAQFIGQCVGLRFHLLCQRARLGTGSFQFIFALLDQFIPLFAGCFQLMGSFVAQLLHFVLTFLQLQLQVVQLTQNRIQTLILGRQMLLSRFNDAAGDAQLFADQECVGFARYAHTQLIGGTQGLQIKLATGVDHTLSLQCKNLQFRIVGGRHQQHTTAAQLLNDGNCQRGALGGIGTGTQLVQQHKGVRHSQFQNTGDFFHVAGEGGKALLNALFVADIHQKFIKHTDLAALVSRNQKTALCHGAQQTGGFQGDRLTAGVRAGDDKGIVFPAQCNIHRNTLLRIDQRVAGTDQIKGRIRPHSGLEGLQLQCKPRLCQQDVDFQHGLVAVLELRLNGGHLCGKGHQNALDLLCLLCAVLQNAGVCLHHSLRFHEHRSARRGYIVDDTAHLAAVFALDRHNIPAVAHGNHTLLQVFGGIHIAHHAFQPVADAVFGGADLFAQLCQRAGGGIRHGIRCQNGAGDLLLKAWLRCQRVKQIIGRQRVMLRGAVPAGQVLKIAQRTGHHQQFAHGKHAALYGTGGKLTDPLYPAKARRAVFNQQGVDGVRLLQCVAHLVRVALRLNGQQHSTGFLAYAALRCTRNDLIQF